MAGVEGIEARLAPSHGRPEIRELRARLRADGAVEDPRLNTRDAELSAVGIARQLVHSAIAGHVLAQTEDAHCWELLAGIDAELAELRARVGEGEAGADEGTPDQRRDRAARAACDALVFHPECPDMPDGVQGLHYAMRDALLAAGFDNGSIR